MNKKIADYNGYKIQETVPGEYMITEISTGLSKDIIGLGSVYDYLDQ